MSTDKILTILAFSTPGVVWVQQIPISGVCLTRCSESLHKIINICEKCLLTHVTTIPLLGYFCLNWVPMKRVGIQKLSSFFFLLLLGFSELSKHQKL